MQPRKAAFSMWTSVLIQTAGATAAGVWLIDGAAVWAIALASLMGWVLLVLMLWVESTRGQS